MACRWHTDAKTGERWHVPECWGTVHDPDGLCHCDDRKPTAEEKAERDAEIFERITAMEKRVTELTAAIAVLREMRQS